MTAEPLLGVCEGPQCPGVDPGAATALTVKGRLCVRCWKRAGEPAAATPPEGQPK